MAKTIGSFDLASLKVLRDDVTQYFWFEPDSSSAWGSGAHVTLYPESQFTDSTSPNYMKGQNIIMNTDGFSIRNGALPMMVLDNDSLDFNAVDTTLGTYTTMATFGLTGATIGQASGAHIQISSSGLDVNLNSSTNIASFGTDGARIGKINGAHSIIDEDGQRFYATDGTTQLAYIGFARGTGPWGTGIAPYYTFGNRSSDTQSTRGNYSMAMGYSLTSSGFSSNAEGVSTEAKGYASHSQNHGTIAAKSSQTAIGAYNVEDTYPDLGHHNNSGAYAFIIGNGTDTNRANALTVDWLGETRIAGNLFTGCNADSTGGKEFGRKTGNHIVVAGIHICWGLETITHSGSGYKEVTITLPYMYDSAPRCFASYGNRPTGGAARTAYAVQGAGLALNQLYVGSYATGSITAYVNWMTIGA